MNARGAPQLRYAVNGVTRAMLNQYLKRSIAVIGSTVRNLFQDFSPNITKKIVNSAMTTGANRLFNMSTDKEFSTKNQIDNTPNIFQKRYKQPFSTDKIVDEVAKVTAEWTSVVKKDIEMRAILNDGREVLARRLKVDDVKMICDSNALCLFDTDIVFSTPIPSLVASIMKAKSVGRESIIAILDGKIVASAEYREAPNWNEEFFDSHPDASLLVEANLAESQICISAMVVSEGNQGLGIGTVLHRAQIQSAKDAGYKAIMCESHSAAIHKIVKKEGGVIGADSYGTLWTLTPIRH
jgi:hypothetical protein